MTRRLVLFTHDYPALRGDHPFVSNEIDALAEAFDDIVIFCQMPLGEDEPRASVPATVSAVHSLAGSPKELLRRGLRAPRKAAVWRNLQADARRIRSLRHLLEWAKAQVRGLGIAGDPRVLQALQDPATTIYHFWGVGTAYSLPFGAPRRAFIRLHRFDLLEDGVYLPLRGPVLGSAQKLLVISAKGAQYLKGLYPHLTPRIVVSRLGSHDYGAAPVAPTTLEVVTCSNLVPVKRVPLIARALKLLAAEQPVHWVHFGDGPERALVEAELATAPAELHADLKGHCANSEVLQYLKEHPVSVFVNASTSEGIPVSLMEAISFGVPIVATDVGSVAELFDGGVAPGALLPETPTEADIAQTIAAVAANPPARAEVRERWATDFNAPINARIAATIISGRGVEDRKASHDD